jgi:hypothetical protein
MIEMLKWGVQTARCLAAEYETDIHFTKVTPARSYDANQDR